MPKRSGCVALAIPPAVHDGAPYAAAEALGLFKEANLSVKTIVFQGAGALLPVTGSLLDSESPRPASLLVYFAVMPLLIRFSVSLQQVNVPGLQSYEVRVEGTQVFVKVG